MSKISDVYKKYSRTHQAEAVSQTQKKRVYVVHGRNTELVSDFFQFLRSLKLEPIEWSEAVRYTGKGAPYIREILDKAFSLAQAIVVLLTPDDEAMLKKEFLKDGDPKHERELTGQARPNVLFEAGLAFGKNPDRTILIKIGTVRPFSDIAGVHVIELNNSSIQRHEVAKRLETAGCDVSTSGTDWYRVGNFDLKDRT